jgi:hypothetical protein
MAITQTIRRFVRERADKRCEYCHADERWQFVAFTMDHIVPVSDDGSDDASNLALACRNCNERRSNRQSAEDPTTQRIVPIFNPRQDHWADHFAWSSDNLRIIGATPTGRATVQALDMNDERRGETVIRVRQRDIKDGYHPPSDDPILTD